MTKDAETEEAIRTCLHNRIGVEINVSADVTASQAGAANSLLATSEAAGEPVSKNMCEAPTVRV